MTIHAPQRDSSTPHRPTDAEHGVWEGRNLAPPAAVTYTHDAWNRLAEVRYGNDIRGEYVYTGLNWRIIKRADTDLDGALDRQRIMYYSASWQLLEERIDDDGSFSPDPGDPDVDRHMQYVWGPRYIDDVILHREDDDKDGIYDDTWYHLTDVQFSTVAVIDDTADVAERVTYTAYGLARHHDAADVDGDGDFDSEDRAIIVMLDGIKIDDQAYRAEADLDRNGVIAKKEAPWFYTIPLPLGRLSYSGVDNQIGYDGYVFNAETLQYHVRFRCYSPTLGRWLERDPAEYFDGMNLYEFATSGPQNNGDWDGRKICAPATGSLRLMMEKYATQFSPFTKGGADPHKRITWKVLSCIACIESSYDPCAAGKTGDFGLMQLTKTGALAQCVKDGILKRPDPDEFTDERRNQCCGIEKQPRFKRGENGKIIKAKDCAKGCDDSIWNVENQLKCAAHYLRYLRDKQEPHWTLEMMLCQYNKGLNDPRCKDAAKAKDVDYVKSVMECINGLDTAKPGPGVVTPPKEWN